MNETREHIGPDALEALGIVVVVPTYNNAGTLAAVLQGIATYSRNILVVNDGSTDATAQILAEFPNVRVITHPRNRGKGRALRTGLQAARDEGFRYAITIDSDGQHFPDDIPVFVHAVEQEPDAFLVGARNLTSDNMPGKNTFANRFSNFWFRLETGIRMDDTQSGFRLYPLNRIGSMCCYTARFEFELEILVFAAWKGYPVKNIPVRVYYPPGKERVSHFRPVRDFTRISLLNTLLVLLTLLWVLPVKFIKSLTIKNIRRFLDEQVIHSGESNGRISLAVMLGVFMGIVPVWGYQMLIAVFLAHLLRLNKVITLVASNISIPPMIPLILYGSYATGCAVLQRPLVFYYRDISLGNIKDVLQQYVVGSFILAVVSGLVAGLVVFCLLAVFRKSRNAVRVPR